MVWCQVDNATQNQGIQNDTNAGSRSFLGGALTVQTALLYIDLGDLERASQTGRSAEGQFASAISQFRQARDKAGTDQQLSNYLKQLDYNAKAVSLGLDLNNLPPLWNFVVSVAQGQGPAALFDNASSGVERLSRQASDFFQKVGAGSFKETEEAALVLFLGVQIIFGSYVSGIFASD